MTNELSLHLCPLRLVLPHDSPKTQLDGNSCSVAKMKQSSMQRISPDSAREPWEKQYQLSETQCIHLQRQQNCGNRSWVEIVYIYIYIWKLEIYGILHADS